MNLEDFIELSDVGYEEAIVHFLQDNGITIDDFEYVGRCDSECLECDAESFSVWRKDIGFMNDGKIFTFDIEAGHLRLCYILV